MKKLTSLFLLFFIAVIGNAQTIIQKADELLKTYAEQYKFYGTALIAKGDQVLLNKGYGFSHVAEKKQNAETSIFQIGSVTKQFTAAIILLLEEEGKLSVQDKISKYFPQLPNGDKITIHNLLTHTSGIFNYTNDAQFMQTGAVKAISKDAMIALFKDRPLDFEPGSKYNYSNSGYVLLGYIIEQVTGKKYEQVAREKIFAPLKMGNTGFDFINLKNSHKTTGYFSVSEESSVPAPVVDSTVSFAAGAMYTTTADLLKWQRALSKGSLLKKTSWDKALTPMLSNYGYGLGIDSVFGQKRIHHGGGIFGYTSNAILLPEQDYTIILFSNASSSLGKLSDDLTAILYNKPYTIPAENKEIKVSDAVLQQYVGEYQLAPSFSITVTLKDNYLYGQATGQPAFQLFAKTDKRFFLKAVPAEVEFFKDANGKVTDMVLYQNGREMKGEKVK